MAILNFFAAIRDGHIDETERNMMGIVYIVLRVAMIVILVTTAFIAIYEYGLVGQSSMTTHVVAQWILVLVLYVNAINCQCAFLKC